MSETVATAGSTSPYLLLLGIVKKTVPSLGRTAMYAAVVVAGGTGTSSATPAVVICPILVCKVTSPVSPPYQSVPSGAVAIDTAIAPAGSYATVPPAVSLPILVPPAYQIRPSGPIVRS